MSKVTSLKKFMDPGKFTGEKREKLKSKMETFLDGFHGSQTEEKS